MPIERSIPADVKLYFREIYLSTFDMPEMYWIDRPIQAQIARMGTGVGCGVDFSF